MITSKDNDILPDEYVIDCIKSREEAEENGLYDSETMNMSWSQEMALSQAMSTLSDLAKETNSTVSELIRANGYEIQSMTGNLTYWMLSEIQNAYSDYCMKNKRQPNVLMIHKSLATYLSTNQLGEANIGQILGHDVVVVEDEDLFKDWEHMFRWVMVSENKNNKIGR